MAFSKWELCNSQHEISGCIPHWRLWSNSSQHCPECGCVCICRVIFYISFLSFRPLFSTSMGSEQLLAPMQTPPEACSGRMVYLFALAWCLRNYPGIGPWWADHHRRKVLTNVSQTSDAQGILCFRWELQGRWQMWPGSHQPVQLFYEWSLEMSHNTTLGWTPGALSPAGFLRRDEQADGAHNCHAKFPLQTI